MEQLHWGWFLTWTCVSPSWPKVAIHAYIAKTTWRAGSYSVGVISVTERSSPLVATTASRVARPQARRKWEISTTTGIAQCICVHVTRYLSGKKLSKIIHSITQYLDHAWNGLEYIHWLVLY